MKKTIKPGVFWVCDDGGDLEIIYDTEEYFEDFHSDFGDEFIVYEKGHREVWKKLSQQFFDGKYAKFAFNDFPRGRVTYDSEEQVYIVDVDAKLKPKFSQIKPLLLEIFKITKAQYHVDRHYKSKMGKFHD